MKIMITPYHLNTDPPLELLVASFEASGFRNPASAYRLHRLKSNLENPL
jgi:hypothetical protein